MSTSGQKRTIVLFEDHQERIDEMATEIKPLLGKKFALRAFPLEVPPTSTNGPYEDRLISALSDGSFGDIVLVVTDRDLSTKQWGGLSEAAVTKAAEKLGLPVACYRRAITHIEDELKRKPGNGQLELPFAANERARRIITICEGFVAMEKLLNAKAGVDMAPIAMKPKYKAKSSARPDVGPKRTDNSPGTLLAGILKQPHVATHFDLFACGDQRAISEIMEVSEVEEGNLTPEQRRRLMIALGVWLADLVMEFPGLLLNEVAAASYLDIDPQDFAKPKVRAVFASAIYQNLPFADDQHPLWWRHLLDELITDKQAVSGRALCETKGIKKLGFCKCSVNPELHAGFYCMATRKPLSEEQSSGRVSWFPVGADLARLTARTHRALSPYIGS